jgi:serine/threonine protein kinase
MYAPISFTSPVRLAKSWVDHLNTRGNFPENIVRFWTAELACGLVYLHSKGIIHRYVPLIPVITRSNPP